MAWFILEEMPASLTLLGGVLILIGIYVSSRNRGS